MIAAILLSILIPTVILLGIIYLIFKVTNKESANIMSPKEFGLELGIFISLVSSVGAFISVVFAAIDKKYPDVLSNNNYASVMNEDVRLAVAVLLVSFPIYLGLAWYRAKYFEKNADRRNVSSLRWPHYVTIFVSVFSIFISTIITIYYYLGGELVARFGFKMLTALIVLFALAGYHYFLLKRDYSKKTKAPIIFSLISFVFVLGSVIYSINVLGSPAEIRKMRFDEARLEDLSTAQSNILNMWQRNKKLPPTLEAVYSDSMNTYQVLPKDPKTGEVYKYQIVSDSTMRKGSGQECVTFYPNKFNNYNQNGNFDISKITCDMPTKATFKLCAVFETVRMYDENGIDQSSNTSFDYMSPKYAGYNSDVSSYYYPGTVDKNPNWNHEAGEHCFERTIDPTRYPSY